MLRDLPKEKLILCFTAPPKRFRMEDPSTQTLAFGSRFWTRLYHKKLDGGANERNSAVFAEVDAEVVMNWYYNAKRVTAKLDERYYAINKDYDSDSYKYELDSVINYSELTLDAVLPNIGGVPSKIKADRSYNSLLGDHYFYGYRTWSYDDRDLIRGALHAAVYGAPLTGGEFDYDYELRTVYPHFFNAEPVNVNTSYKKTIRRKDPSETNHDSVWSNNDFFSLGASDYVALPAVMIPKSNGKLEFKRLAQRSYYELYPEKHLACEWELTATKDSQEIRRKWWFNHHELGKKLSRESILKINITKTFL